MENKKNHVTKKRFVGFFLSVLVTSFIIFIFVISIFSPKDSEGEVDYIPNEIAIYGLIAGLLVLVLGSIYAWIILKKHVFYEEEDKLIIEKGLFFKRKIEIPYANIHTISIKRNFLDLILGISKIQIDTGTIANSMPEGNIPLSKNNALIIKDYIEKRKNNIVLEFPSLNQKQVYVNTEEENVFYQVKWYQLLLMGVIKQGYLAIVFFVTTFLVFIFNLSVLDPDPSNRVELSSAFLSFLLIIVSIGILLSVVQLFVFYGYKVTVKDQELEYQYGLLTKTIFKVNIKRINALYVKQSLLYRLFGYVSLSASIIGIGEPQDSNSKSGNESKYLLPIVKKEKALELMKICGYDYDIYNNVPYEKPQRFKKTNFMIIPLIFITIIYATSFIIANKEIGKLIYGFIALSISYLVVALGLYLRMKNHGYTIDDYLVARKGAFTVSAIIVKRNRVQMVRFTQTPVRILEKVGYIKIHYKEMLGVISLDSYAYDDYLKIANKIV
ncbi:MAG: PH domain-containing protein [Acholeplasma sp.]|nr:PH domain-containing protein [Acholeplasma sp.]